MMRPVKLPVMTNDEIEALIEDQIICRIAFRGEEYPYIAPFRYITMNKHLYFHFTDYGKKMKLLREDNKVCVTVETFKPDLSSYMFLSMRGKLSEVTNPEERKDAVRLFAQTGKEKLSKNFLAAHGFDPEDSWDEFAPEKDLVIIKLTDIVERVGLRSP